MFRKLTLWLLIPVLLFSQGFRSQADVVSTKYYVEHINFLKFNSDSITVDTLATIAKVVSDTVDAAGLVLRDTIITQTSAVLNSENLTVLGGIKKYVALLSQTGTAAPVATVLENSLGGDVVWSRIDVGTYLGTLSNAFPSLKTIYTPKRSYMSPISIDGTFVDFSSDGSGNFIAVSTYDYLGNPVDSVLDTPLTVEVYP